MEVVAWGSGEESWSIDYHVIEGDLDIPEGSPNSPWNDFTDYVRTSWRHESGVDLAVSYTFIDSGGTDGATQSVYNYVKRHRGDRIFAIKGRGGDGLPIVGPPNRKRSGKAKRPVDLYSIGTDTTKSVVMRRLKQADPGPGYCHFPAGRDVEWFRQLTAERPVTKFVKGFRKTTFEKPDKDRRNEAFDCRCYAFAAFVMAAPQLDKIAYRIKKQAAEKPATAPAKAKPAEPAPDKTTLDPTPPPEDSPKQPRRAKRRGGFVKNW
jgi:phage terminase large subunit GpA-like protein